MLFGAWLLLFYSGQRRSALVTAILRFLAFTSLFLSLVLRPLILFVIVFFLPSTFDSQLPQVMNNKIRKSQDTILFVVLEKENVFHTQTHFLPSLFPGRGISHFVSSLILGQRRQVFCYHIFPLSLMLPIIFIVTFFFLTFIKIFLWLIVFPSLTFSSFLFFSSSSPVVFSCCSSCRWWWWWWL